MVTVVGVGKSKPPFETACHVWPICVDADVAAARQAIWGFRPCDDAFGALKELPRIVPEVTQHQPSLK